MVPNSYESSMYLPMWYERKSCFFVTAKYIINGCNNVDVKRKGNKPLDKLTFTHIVHFNNVWRHAFTCTRYKIFLLIYIDEGYVLFDALLMIFEAVQLGASTQLVCSYNPVSLIGIGVSCWFWDWNKVNVKVMLKSTHRPHSWTAYYDVLA